MCPIPQYPLYSATIQMLGGVLVPYLLEEEKAWALDTTDLNRSLQAARQKGITVGVTPMFLFSFGFLCSLTFHGGLGFERTIGGIGILSAKIHFSRVNRFRTSDTPGKSLTERWE